jgi:hypothetical protein
MYKSASRNMQKKMGADTTWRPKKAKKARRSVSKDRQIARRKWAPLIAQYVEKERLLPATTPSWLLLEMASIGIDQWLNRHTSGRPRPGDLRVRGPKSN